MIGDFLVAVKLGADRVINIIKHAKEANRSAVAGDSGGSRAGGERKKRPSPSFN